VREQQFLRNVQAIRDALFRAASELDQLVKEITSGEHAMRPDRAQAIASMGAYEHSALEKYRRTLDAMMEILLETRAEQPPDSVNAGGPEINDCRSALHPSNHPDKRTTTTLQAVEGELREAIESLRSANDAICSANQTIEMLTQALVARHTGDPPSPWSESSSGMPADEPVELPKLRTPVTRREGTTSSSASRHRLRFNNLSQESRP
jgi:hypothetical protein